MRFASLHPRRVCRWFNVTEQPTGCCCRSVGVILLQLAVPQLRTGNALRNLNIELGRADYDLDEWRCPPPPPPPGF